MAHSSRGRISTSAGEARELLSPTSGGAPTSRKCRLPARAGAIVKSSALLRIAITTPHGETGVSVRQYSMKPPLLCLSRARNVGTGKRICAWPARNVLMHLLRADVFSVCRRPSAMTWRALLVRGVARPAKNHRRGIMFGGVMALPRWPYIAHQNGRHKMWRQVESSAHRGALMW